ncbi:MAG: class I adenylate-forming enzyme family protein [Sciscionella sp.]
MESATTGDLIAELVTGSLPGAFSATAARYPDRPALLFPAGRRGWQTHATLDEAAARTAGWLIKEGLRPGERVLLCGHNDPALVTAYLAILRSGAVVVLANPAYTADELTHLVTDSGARLAIAARPAAAALANLPVSMVSLDEPLPVADPAPVTALGPGDIAMLAYTSGTTGAPKGVQLTHGNLLSSIRAAMLAWQWSTDDVLVHALPLSHQHGLGGVHATLLAGSAAVILPNFDPGTLTEAALAHSASVLFAVPAIYQRLAETPAAAARLAEAGLRLAISGSAPLSQELAGKVAAIMGMPPLERYGSTESGLNVSNPIDGPRRPGTVGLPLPGVQLRIADEAGGELPVGEEGEILLRGPQVFSGYWQRPDATAEAFHDGGWFRTGDLGRIDESDGYLSITGRIKELIITGGMNVYPREVELALQRHPTVAQAAVAGLPSARWGEQVTAWVVPAEGAEVDPEQLIAHSRRLLAAYKCPKQVFLSESLPHNSMGKLRRRALVAALGLDAPQDTTALERAATKLRQAEL